MRPRVYQWCARGAALLAAAALGLVWRANHATDAARDELARLATQRSALEARARTLSSKQRELELATAQARLALAQLDASAKRSAAAPPAISHDHGTDPLSDPLATPPNTTAKATLWEHLSRRDPEMQAIQLAADRAKFVTTYGPFFKTAQLTPDRIDRLTELMAQRAARDSDLLATIEAKGLSEDDPAIRALRDRTEDDFQAAQRQLLGEDGYRRFDEYRSADLVRDTVRSLATNAAALDIPLSPQQAEQLTQAIVQSAAAARPNEFVKLSTIDWERVENSAKTILTSQQMTLLTQSGASVHGHQSRFNLRLTRLINAAREADLKVDGGTTP